MMNKDDISYLNDPEKYVVYLTDSENNRDILKMMEKKSICISNDQDFNELETNLEYNDQLKKKTAILFFDSDTEQKKQIKGSVMKMLQYYGINRISMNGIDNLRDSWMNDPSFTKNFKSFTDRVEYEADPAPDKVSRYFDHLFEEDLQTFKEGSNRQTGFAALDRNTRGIYSGLYVIGAVSSLGKTTFSHQLADNIARTGQHVLYFSLEQSRFEMVSKSISRESYRYDPAAALTSLQIREGQTTPATEAAKKIYLEKYADNISIIEGNFGTTAEGIRSYIDRYIKRNGHRPTVFIDYLQIVQPDKDQDTGRKPTDAKTITDMNITALKRISRDFNIPVFVISSLNRSNYLNEIDFESFKESGGIEYGADMVLGLQLAAIHEQIFDQDKKINEKRQRIREAKSEIPRKVELVCLKSRTSPPGWTVTFSYDPRYDYFKEAEEVPLTGTRIRRI